MYIYIFHSIWDFKKLLQYSNIEYILFGTEKLHATEVVFYWHHIDYVYHIIMY